VHKHDHGLGRAPTAPAAGGVFGRRASLPVVEAAGYLGGALAVAAGFAGIRQAWRGIPLVPTPRA
jgi:hypothetical protein